MAYSGSTLAQVKAGCLTAPSHYLNQCWLIIKDVLWHSTVTNFTRSAHELIIIRCDRRWAEANGECCFVDSPVPCLELLEALTKALIGLALELQAALTEVLQLQPAHRRTWELTVLWLVATDTVRPGQDGCYFCRQHFHFFKCVFSNTFEFWIKFHWNMFLRV